MVLAPTERRGLRKTTCPVDSLGSTACLQALFKNSELLISQNSQIENSIVFRFRLLAEGAI